MSAVLGRFGRSRRLEPGWAAISLRPGLLDLVQGRSGGPSSPVISRWASRTFEPGPGALERIARELRLANCRCSVLLQPGEYQMLLVEAPAVPEAELRSALRWRIKDMIDYHVDDATIDVLDIPPEAGAPTRSHWMYAVAARNDVIQSRVREFEDARIPLEVIDIPEAGQRNIAALYETPGRGLALLHPEGERGLLTITFNGELYLTRRIDTGGEAAESAGEGAPESAYARVLIELQRTFDHFERQFRFVSVTELLLGPDPKAAALADYLGANLGLPVRRIDLGERLRFEGEPAPDLAEQAGLFHLIGASLRHEGKVL